MNRQTPLASRFFDSKVLIAGGTLLVIFFATAFAKEFIRRYDIQQEIVALEQEAASLEARQTELQGLLEYFQSDAFKEQEARTRLGFQKEGESLVVIPQSETVRGTVTESNPLVSSEEPEDNVQKWWRYFFES